MLPFGNIVFQNLKKQCYLLVQNSIFYITNLIKTEVQKLKDFSVKISNDWLRCEKPNFKKICCYYLLYALAGRDDVGGIIPKYAVTTCGYKSRKGTKGVDQQFDDIFRELHENGYYSLIDGEVVKKDRKAFMYQLNYEMYDLSTNFTLLNSIEFRDIVQSNENKNRDKALIVYLYVKSFFNKGSFSCGALAFFQSVEHTAQILGYTKNTVTDALDELVFMGKLFKQMTKRQNSYFPNYYIVNMGQSGEEIRSTVRNTDKYIETTYGSNDSEEGDEE